MKFTKVLILTVLAVLAVLIVHACNGGSASPRPSRPAKNIILLVGDGMGPEVVGLARDYSQTINKRELWIERAIAEGRLALVHASALGTLATDSAAAATALATGERTVNGMISISPQGRPLTTILEMAKKNSRSTGLVTTTRLTHATPACFAAHVEERDSEGEIAQQMFEAGVDVMLGGGLAYWVPEDTGVSDFGKLTPVAGAGAQSERTDGSNLLERAAAAGYEIATNRDELLAARAGKKLLGLFAASHMPYALDRRSDDAANTPSLAEMTEAALAILSKNQKGFFLMVEGGRIDHAAHNNDIASLIADTIDFDNAVGVARAFAKKTGETAVFITADHATGAPCVTARYMEEVGDTVYPDDGVLKAISRQNASFEYLGYAIGKKLSAGDIKKLVREHIGVELTDGEAAFILKGEPVSPFHVIKPKYRQLGYPMLALARVVGTRYGIAWATAEHYATPVLLVGYGSRADIVHGYVENTDIFRIMRTAGGL